MLKHFQERLRILPHHQALFLLKTCFGFPKFTHALRSTPCWHSPSLAQMDATLKDILEEILNVNLDSSKWLQATLPVNRGGLGVRRFEQLSIPAFIASAAGTERLVKACLSPDGDNLAPDMYVTEASNIWLQITRKDSVPESYKQKDWDEPICDSVVNSVMNSMSEFEKALLSATSSKHSSEWLRAMPISTCGLALSNDELRISVCLRLGLPLFRSHQCICGETVDALGQHCFSCKRNSGKQARHHAINQLIRRELSRCQLPSHLEPSGLFPNSELRPDGITSCPWSRGRQLVWDFTCTHTLSASNIRLTKGEASKAAELAEIKKFKKYKTLPNHLQFIPICVETLGSYGPQATAFFKELGKRQAEQLEDATASSKLRQRLSMELQRGNAKCVTFSLARSLEQ